MFLGGTLLTIFGLGFDRSTSVTLDGAECVIQSLDYEEIKCITPEMVIHIKTGTHYPSYII